MRGLILGSGGAKGAYQVGILSRLAEDPRYSGGFDFISGSSVGALNASFLAQFNKKEFPQAVSELRALWQSGLSVLQWRWPWGIPGLWKESFSKNSKLFAFINKNIDVEKLKESDVGVSVTVTQLDSGQVRSLSSGYFDFKRGLLASASIPGVFPPVYLEGYPYVDGAVKDSAPLRPAIRHGCDELLVLPLTNPDHLDKYTGQNWKSIDVLMQSLEIQQVELLRGDLQECSRRNYHRAGGQVSVTVLFPAMPFDSSLDFSAEVVAENIQRGRVDASLFLG